MSQEPTNVSTHPPHALGNVPVDTLALRNLDPPRPDAPIDEGSIIHPAREQRPDDAADTNGRPAVDSLEPSPQDSIEAIRTQRGAARGDQSPTLFDRVEAFVSRLSVRDNFWHGICSLLWLPLAFFSGIRMKQLDQTSFAAVLPFRRFNRNWYRAMAGGALLANSEIAGGMYVFGLCGGDYTVVCKTLTYTFLRPCFGPAVYRMTPREQIAPLVAQGGEFNITLDLEISQQGLPGERDRRVGRCEVTFHVTPKVHHKARQSRRRPF
jgi:hypothetical protein